MMVKLSTLMKDKPSVKNATSKVVAKAVSKGPQLTEKAAKKRLSKAQKGTLAMRKQLWPNITGTTFGSGMIAMGLLRFRERCLSSWS